MVVVVQAILFICKNGDGLPYARENSDRDMLFYVLEAEGDEGNEPHRVQYY